MKEDLLSRSKYTDERTISWSTSCCSSRQPEHGWLNKRKKRKRSRIRWRRRRKRNCFPFSCQFLVGLKFFSFFLIFLLLLLLLLLPLLPTSTSRCLFWERMKNGLPYRTRAIVQDRARASATCTYVYTEKTQKMGKIKWKKRESEREYERKVLSFQKVRCKNTHFSSKLRFHWCVNRHYIFPLRLPGIAGSRSQRTDPIQGLPHKYA